MKVVYEVGGGCELCLMCVYGCPVKAISIIEDVSCVIDKTKCIGCGSCEDTCQAEVIHPVEIE